MVEAILGVLGTVVAAVIGGAVALRTRGPRFEKPELVDVAFSQVLGDDRSTAGDLSVSSHSDLPGVGECVLDVKLRNPGEQPIFVVRAILEILDARILPEWDVPNMGNYITATEIVSARYDVRLPLPGERAGMQVSHDLSQVVPPTGVDRFQIRLGLDGYGERSRKSGLDFSALYRLRIRLGYGQRHEELVSQPIIVGVPSPPRVLDAAWVRSELSKYAAEVSEFESLGYLEKLNMAPVKWGRNQAIWEPKKTLQKYFAGETDRLLKLTEFAQLPGMRDPALDDTLDKAQALLRELPGLRAEFLRDHGSTNH